MADALAIPRPKRSPRRLLVLSAIAAVPAAALAVALVLALDGGSDRPAVKTFVGAGRRFAISYPARGWEALPAGRLAKLAGRPDAVLRSRGGAATVVVRAQPPIHASLERLGRALTPQLRRRFEGFRPLGARVTRLVTGPALVYTFLRGGTQAVQSVVLVPAARRSYELDVVTRAGAPAAAAQAGAIVRSFVASR